MKTEFLAKIEPIPMKTSDCAHVHGIYDRN